MTEQYTPPFEGGKDPDPATKAKTANRAKILARRAMKKAAMKEEANKSGLSPEQIARRKAMDADDFKKRREEMNAKRQAGTAPLRTTYREEVELDEAFINGREFAAHGLMHPKHAGEPIHRVADHYVDFYASGTGDKMQGKVKFNDGKTVHIQAHPKMGDGKLHKFKVSADLPKMHEEVEQIKDYTYDATKKVIPPTKKPEPVSKTKKGFGQLGPEKPGNNKGSNSYMSASERNRYEEPKPKTPGRPTPIPDGLPRPGNRPKPIPAMGALKNIQEKKMGYDNLASTIKSKLARKKVAEAHDPVGKEDADINNDGKVDKTDVYLHTKRRAIGKAIANRQAKAGK